MIGIAAIKMLAVMISYSVYSEASKDGDGFLYNADSGRLVERELKTGATRQILKLADTSSGAKLTRSHYDISRDRTSVAYAEVSADSTDKDDTRRYVVVYDIKRDKTIRRLDISGRVVFPLSISPDGKHIAVIAESKDGSIPQLRVFRMSDGRSILSSVVEAYNGSPTWSPSGTRVAIANRSVKPVIINLADMKKTILPVQGHPIYSPDGKYVVVGESHLWSSSTKKLTKVGLTDKCNVVGWSPDSTRILYTKEDRCEHYSLYAYDIVNGRSRLIAADCGSSDTYPTLWRH
jgi:Tol biopolymer transport system component